MSEDKMAITVGSLFAGIGGFDRGFENASMKVVFQVEKDPDCQRVLRHHWPDALLLSDVRECGKHNLPPVDVISFGSPCQDLSVAGKRKGMAGERSGLFYEAVRIVRELQPALAVWENVPGAFSSHAGRDFAQALHALRECGARDLCWRVLDARYFGVAQRRRRVFLVADFGGERAGQILLESPCGCGHPAPGSAAEPSVAASLGSRSASPGINRPGRGGEDDSNLVAGTLGATGNGRGWNDDLDRAGAFVVSDKGNSTWVEGRPTRSASDDNGSNHLVAHTLRGQGSEDGTGRGTPLVAFDWQSGGDVRLNCSDQHTSALQASQTPAIGGGRMMVRRLTPLECCRLQGFPDDWLDLEPPLSDSAKYRMLGNACAVPVCKWIGQRIMEAMQ